MANTPCAADLPELLLFADGRRVSSPEDWPARRAELLEALQAIQYGHLPPPLAVAARRLDSATYSREQGLIATHYRLTAGTGELSLPLTVCTPAGAGPFPVVVGDGHSRHLADGVLLVAARRGYALAIFSRDGLAPDNPGDAGDRGLCSVFPGGDFGALAAWAWGYHRVVDFLQHLPTIDHARIAVTGHSRSGKAALLAGATDERVALTAPNNSGCCGAGCSRFPDEGGERLADIIRSFPNWFCPRLKEYVGRESELPFDQHALKAAVAPRSLLSTEARGDIWASPRGTRLTHEAAREVYRFLGVGDRIGIWYRDGAHAHTLPDWQALLDFADLQFYGRSAPRDFDMRP